MRRLVVVSTLFLLSGLLVASPRPASADVGTAAGLTVGVTRHENFNGLAATGTSTVTPVGWGFAESGTNANTTYTAGFGVENTGDTYSYGTFTETDRALGQLRSETLVSTLGVRFVNEGTLPIASLEILAVGEQWRYGAPDRMDAEYSLDAVSLTTGTWTAVDGLDFVAPMAPGGSGPLDGNHPANQRGLVAVLRGLDLATGDEIWVRWVDLDPFGPDAGLALDSVMVSPSGPACTITGTFGADVLIGTSGPDVICGLHSGDSIAGLGGNDILLGGAGNDFLAGGRGDDMLDGGPDIDTATFSDSGVSGSVTADLANWYASNAVLGQDTFVREGLTSKIENLTGGPGDDFLFGNPSRNVLVGEGGSDEIIGGGEDDLLRGGGGDDTLDGGGGNDRIQPGLGDDILPAGPGVNTLDYSDLGGTGAGQTIQTSPVSSTGFAGADEIQVGAGGESFANVFGSARNDVIDLRAGGIASIVIGGGGNDQIRVDDADALDQVFGGADSDTCTVDASEPEDCELP